MRDLFATAKFLLQLHQIWCKNLDCWLNYVPKTKSNIAAQSGCRHVCMILVAILNLWLSLDHSLPLPSTTPRYCADISVHNWVGFSDTMTHASYLTADHYHHSKFGAKIWINAQINKLCTKTSNSTHSCRNLQLISDILNILPFTTVNYHGKFHANTSIHYWLQYFFLKSKVVTICSLGTRYFSAKTHFRLFRNLEIQQLKFYQSFLTIRLLSLFLHHIHSFTNTAAKNTET